MLIQRRGQKGEERKEELQNRIRKKKQHLSRRFDSLILLMVETKRFLQGCINSQHTYKYPKNPVNS